MEFEVGLRATFLMKHEWMASAKWTSFKWVGPLLGVWVVTSIESCTELCVAEHFVRLVNGCHFLFGFVLVNSTVNRFVRVVLFRGFSIRRLNLLLISIVGNAENLIVILSLATFERNLSLVQDGVNLILLIWSDLCGLLKCLYCSLKILLFEKSLAPIDKTPKGIRIR